MEKYLVIAIIIIAFIFGIGLMLSAIGLIIFAKKGKKESIINEQEKRSVSTNINIDKPSKIASKSEVLPENSSDGYKYPYYDDDKKILNIYLEGLAVDDHYSLSKRNSNPCDYYYDDYLRLVCCDIDKLDNSLNKLIDLKPRSCYKEKKVYIRIFDDSKSIEWLTKNKVKIQKYNDNDLEFIYGFNAKKYENVFYNINQDCFTEVYDVYVGYGVIDCAATYYDVCEREYTFDAESSRYHYERKLHELFKQVL